MTVQDLINEALDDIGVLQAGESPAPEETDIGLKTLNELISSFSAQALPIPQLTRTQLALSGDESYGIFQRFLKIRGASLKVVGIRVPYRVVFSEGWHDQNEQFVVYYDAGYPNPNVYLRPAPTSGSLEFDGYVALDEFGGTAEVVSLPPGYARALRLALAVELAPKFGRPLGDIVSLANDAKMSIQGLNQATLGAPAPATAQPAQQ